MVSVGAPTTAGGVASFPVVIGPADSTPAAGRVIAGLRTTLDRAAPGTLVGGQSAVDDDLQQATHHDERVVIPLVLAVVFLVLVVLLQALVGPLLLVASVVLSFLAAFGVAATLSTSVLEFAAISPYLPLFGFIFLVALGCDDNIFLMARVREEARRAGPRAGTTRALSATGAVIASAGLVLAGTFAPLISSSLVVLAELGLLVAFGVLLDTFVVRTLLVPALAIDVGRAWWVPGPLSRARLVPPLAWSPARPAGAPGPAATAPLATLGAVVSGPSGQWGARQSSAEAAQAPPPSPAAAPSPGWFPDPSGEPGALRYWDGAAWTTHVARRSASS